MVPTTAQQVGVFLVLVLPGVFYQAVRERLRGAHPSEREASHRLIRAIAASVVLDAGYALIAGPWLVDLARGDGRRASPLGGLAESPRQAGLVGLLLVVAVPAGVAWLEARLAGRGSKVRHQAPPTAWDALFRNRSSCFVRVRLKSGGLLGGWYGAASAASAYPHPSDLYLQAQYYVGEDGEFGALVDDSGGVYVRGEDIEVVEIIEQKGSEDVQQEERS